MSNIFFAAKIAVIVRYVGAFSHLIITNPDIIGYIFGFIDVVVSNFIIFLLLHVLQRVYEELIETKKTALRIKETPDATTSATEEILAKLTILSHDMMALEAGIDYVSDQVHEIEELGFTKKVIKKQQKNMKKLFKHLEKLEKDLPAQTGDEDGCSIYEIGQKLAKAMSIRKEKARKAAMSPGEQMYRDAHDSEEAKQEERVGNTEKEEEPSPEE